MEPFVGQLLIVGFSFPPRGYASCSGQIMSIAQNTALFSLLGTTYGGNGQTTFALPNLGGRVAVGQGQSPGTSNYSLGEVAGAETVALNVNQMPNHTHVAATTVTPNSSGMTVSTTINARTGVPPAQRVNTPVGNVITLPVVGGGGGAVNAFAAPDAGSEAQMAATAATTSVSGSLTATAATTVQAVGGNQPFGVLQPLVVLNYVIAIQGVFPSRN